MGLITWAEFCAYEGSDSGNTTDQARTQKLIDSASASIERYCSRRFALASYERTDLWASRINLDAFPVTTCQVFIDDLEVFGAGTEKTVGFYVDKASGIIKWQYGYDYEGWPCKVVWTGGLSTIPEDLKEACFKLVKWDKSRVFASQIGMRAVVSGDVTTTYADAMPYEVKQILDSYRVA